MTRRPRAVAAERAERINAAVMIAVVGAGTLMTAAALLMTILG